MEDKLTIYLEDASGFTDISNSMYSYIKDAAYIPLLAGEKLWIGYKKPIFNLYLEAKEADVSDASVTYKYYNGTDYTALPNLHDDSWNLNRSGFIQWQFEEMDKVQDSWKVSTVNSVELYWIEVTPSNDLYGELISSSGTGHSTLEINLSDTQVANYTAGDQIYVADGYYGEVASVDSTPGSAKIEVSPAHTGAFLDYAEIYKQVEFMGLNLVFADDSDLKEEYENIEKYKKPSNSSFIGLHVSTRKDIVQLFRNRGHTKKEDNVLKDINQFDFLSFDEIRRAAVYWALHKVFFNVSDDVQDKWNQLSMSYKKRAKSIIDVYKITLDANDDGQVQRSEKTQTATRVTYG